MRKSTELHRPVSIWYEPSPEVMADLLRRPAENQEEILKKVEYILSRVHTHGDQALKEFSRQFDKAEVQDFLVPAGEFVKAVETIPTGIKESINLAARNIHTFHGHYRNRTREKVETMPGVTCWQETRPIQKVGLYIPGGTAPLFSTVLMLGIPARLAGCPEIILCTPPGIDGQVHPLILYCAGLTGISRIFRIGGAQAIAAMAYGTGSIPRVHKIFGPGNRYVTAAKQLLSRRGCSIDLPAGPSELVILADRTGNPAFIAADILSQAEHGEDSQIIFFSLAEELITATCQELSEQIKSLPRRKIIEQCLKNCRMIYLSSGERTLEYINRYAPEHLILAVSEPREWVARIQSTGSIFLGNNSAESIGDYASGTNHTLPTGGYAKSVSGVSVDSFLKTITCQEITRQGLLNIGPAVETMAEEEGLDAHKMAVRIRQLEAERS